MSKMAIMFSCLPQNQHSTSNMKTEVRGCIPEMPQELDLAQSALTEHGIVERGDTLDGDSGTRRDMDRRANEMGSNSRDWRVAATVVGGG
jgi:hypothetical protein